MSVWLITIILLSSTFLREDIEMRQNLTDFYTQIPLGLIIKTRNMKKQFILISGILLMSIGIFAQSSKLKVEKDEITIPLKLELKISVEVNDGKLNNFKILNQAKVKKSIDMMKALDNVEKKNIVSNEIELKFCYADFMGSKLVVLTTVHHLENSMTFKAKIKIKGRKDYVETSIETKHPNVFSIEQWQDEIESIVLYEFEIIKEQN